MLYGLEAQNAKAREDQQRPPFGTTNPADAPTWDPYNANTDYRNVGHGWGGIGTVGNLAATHLRELGDWAGKQYGKLGAWYDQRIQDNPYLRGLRTRTDRFERDREGISSQVDPFSDPAHQYRVAAARAGAHDSYAARGGALSGAARTAADTAAQRTAQEGWVADYNRRVKALTDAYNASRDAYVRQSANYVDATAGHGRALGEGLASQVSGYNSAINAASQARIQAIHGWETARQAARARRISKWGTGITALGLALGIPLGKGGPTLGALLGGGIAKGWQGLFGGGSKIAQSTIDRIGTLYPTLRNVSPTAFYSPVTGFGNIPLPGGGSRTGRGINIPFPSGNPWLNTGRAGI